MPNELLDVNTEPVIKAQTEAPGSEPTSWMPLSDEQRAGAPEHIRKLLEDKKWNSFEQLGTGYADLEKVLGRGEHIFKPESPESEAPEEWSKFWTAYGRPESFDKYEYIKDENIPFDENLINRWKEASFKSGKTQQQFEGDIALYTDIIREVTALDAQEKEDAIAQDESDKAEVRKALVQRCGGEVAYQNQIIKAREMADALGIFQAAEKLKISKEPEFIAMLMDMDEKLTEGIIPKSGDLPTTTKDPKAELKEIMDSETFKNRLAPGHKEIMKRYMEINNIIANSGLAPKRVQDG